MCLGISPSKFDELRKSGRIGPAKILDGRKLMLLKCLTNSLTPCQQKGITKPKTGRSVYERDSLPQLAP